MNRAALFFLAILFLFKVSTVRAEPDEVKRTLGIGFAYAGGLLRYGFLEHWSAEFHYLVGSADSNDGNVNSSVIGGRGYRHFRTDQRVQPFVGIGFAYVSAQSPTIKSSGYLAGGFTGVEIYILPRLSIGLDLGPYYLSLKDKDSTTAESGMDFILNTFLNFYIF